MSILKHGYSGRLQAVEGEMAHNFMLRAKDVVLSPDKSDGDQLMDIHILDSDLAML
jgi:hypothetical protein